MTGCNLGYLIMQREMCVCRYRNEKKEHINFYALRKFIFIGNSFWNSNNNQMFHYVTVLRMFSFVLVFRKTEMQTVNRSNKEKKERNTKLAHAPDKYIYVISNHNFIACAS